MLTDIFTMGRKDLREILMSRSTGKRGGSWINILIFIGLIGVFMPLQSGMEWLTNPLLPLVWSWIPVFLVVGVVTDSFAGERERNTLETLLASRLSDRAILFGKIFAAVFYGWGILVLSLFAGAVTMNIAYWQGSILFYQPLPFFGTVLASFLVSLLMSTLGVFVSLNAPTARAAYQRLSFIMLPIWFLPTILVTFVPLSVRESIGRFFESINLTQLSVGALVVLLILDGVLLVVAMGRFKRAKLILN